MAEQDFNEFYARVARIEKARAMGYGFEAEGTLGRSHYHRPTRRRPRILAPLLFATLSFFCLKGALHHQIGHDTYVQRLELMQASESGMERVAAALMQADGLTMRISDQIESALH
ncbi:hypothetical protein [Gemmobacter caeruleus]|uniref:hypothetical protein n=1 Tax=Gemmobacter caeruleus TaxID=2595004 RepID=UPI0011ED6CDA|nr:hypothetical protein [Gemmobacter caeruleus]